MDRAMYRLGWVILAFNLLWAMFMVYRDNAGIAAFNAFVAGMMTVTMIRAFRERIR